MKNLIKTTTIAAALAATSMGAIADDFAIVKTLKVTPAVSQYAENAPAAIGEYKVAGPIYTREIIAIESDGDAVYGEINGVVTTREIVGFESDGDAIYGAPNGFVLGLALTPEQVAALDQDD